MIVDIIIVCATLSALVGLGYYVVNRYTPLDEMADVFDITDEDERELFKNT